MVYITDDFNPKDVFIYCLQGVLTWIKALSLHAVIQFVHFNFNAVEITRGQPGVYMSLKKIEVITIKKLLCYNFS